MILRHLIILLIFLPIKVFAVIEVDITRGNLNPLPIAVSPLSIDEESRKSFKEVLINNKFKVIEEKIFSDHYEYKVPDIQKILEISKKKNLQTLTTEKDYVKIPRNLRNEIDFIEIDLKIDEEEKLVKFIKSKINETN